jgi:hypothetical protein
MKQKRNNSPQLLKSPIGGFRGLYTPPRIELILHDNQIAFALASAPPAGPEETSTNLPFNFNNNPFVENNLA